MPTTVILVRSGETVWRPQGRVLGRRDISISAEGQQQAHQALGLLAHFQISELLSSPLSRAIQTAEVFAKHYQIGIGRDPRLMEVDIGKWEGATWEDLLNNDKFQDLIAGDATEFPDGESLDNACRRAIASVEQAATDNPRGANIVMVTHCFLIRLMLAHFLGMPKGSFLQLQIHHGSVSILRFTSFLQHPQVLGINLCVPAEEILAPLPV